MEHVAAGRDTLVVMPTGSGKSAVYHVPALLLDGPTVVVSPLIALQRDQVAGPLAHAGAGGAGVLRIEFRDDADRLEDVGWDAFFATFDDSDVDFLYQERTSDGSVSRFHKFVRAND